jgi:hypothetical protein
MIASMLAMSSPPTMAIDLSSEEPIGPYHAGYLAYFFEHLGQLLSGDEYVSQNFQKSFRLCTYGLG